MTAFNQRISNTFSLIARIMSLQISATMCYLPKSMSSPGTILQGDLFYLKGLIPAQCIPNYTFQNCDFSKLSHMNISNSRNTVKKSGRNTHNGNTCKRWQHNDNIYTLCLK